MRCTFHTTTIASISGVTLVATSIPNAHSQHVISNIGYAYEHLSSSTTGSLRSTTSSKVQGNHECSFVNAFKIQESAADTGILSCGAGLTCIEDVTASLGGRCVSIGDDLEEHSNDQSPPRGLEEACTFANGTAGVKCDGFKACGGTTVVANVGCGSCIGGFACYNQYPATTIAENSCVGYFSCFLTGKYGGGIPTTIGEGSCLGNRACASLIGSVGKGSCTGESIKGQNFGAYGYSCANFLGTIGDNSCYEYVACYLNFFAPGPVVLEVGDNSCRGPSSCGYAEASVAIGDFSCRGSYACRYHLYYDGVGFNSCNGNYACSKVGDTLIGNCICNGDYACDSSSGVDLSGDECAPSASPSDPGNVKSKTGKMSKSKSKK